MSKLLEMTAEVVVNEDTGKRRVMTHLYRDTNLDLSFILNADEAEQWGAKLMFLANECRKKNPTQKRESIQFLRQWWREMFHKRWTRKSTGK